jgi:class 3 adenylate cyclase
MVAAISFGTLLIVNSIIKELRQREEELSVTNQRIYRLSEKLKIYLPHQFVKSLADGDRETLPDYRRKRLTIFFSDVEGFTKWTDKLEPEEVREILNHYLSEMSAIAHKHGGTIDKFIGDLLMIFFGDPEFTDDKDHAVRCVKMAMQMQERMDGLRKQWEGVGYDEPLRIRMGINTGWATVGNFGSEDRLNYTALGSAVNLASRLEAACAPDRITISHTIWLLIKDEIDCEPKGEIEVKGFPEPVKIYEVEGFKSGI